jgi:hypothetical protein
VRQERERERERERREREERERCKKAAHIHKNRGTKSRIKVQNPQRNIRPLSKRQRKLPATKTTPPWPAVPTGRRPIACLVLRVTKNIEDRIMGRGNEERV